jgi:hypothetical protein
MCQMELAVGSTLQLADPKRPHGAQPERGAAGFGGFVVARDALRTDVDRKLAGDVVWALIDPGLYHLLVIEMAWTPAQFQAWLAQTVKGQLLQD